MKGVKYMKPKKLLFLSLLALGLLSCGNPSSSSSSQASSESSGSSSSISSSEVSSVSSSSSSSEVSSSVASNSSSSEESSSVSSSVSSSSSSSEESSSTSSSSSSSSESSSSVSSSSSSSESSSSSSTPVGLSVEDAIANGINAAGLVKSGTVTMNEYSKTEIAYELGTDINGTFVHYTEVGYFSDEYYVLLDDAGTVVPVKVEDTGISKPYGDFSNKGYLFSGVIDYSTSYDGAEGLVSGLYATAKENTNHDFSESAVDGDYEFSFGYFGGWSFKVVKVEFSLSINNVFDSVKVTSADYSSNSYIQDDATGEVVLIDGATPGNTLTIEVAQQEGTRTLVNPYDVNGSSLILLI